MKTVSKTVAGFKSKNDLLKAKLSAEFGMIGSDTSTLPSEFENAWLNYIYNFELLSKNSKEIKVIEVIGNPVFRKAEEMTDEEITLELDSLLELIDNSRVELDFCCKYKDRTIYNFITEEFLYMTINDIRIEGIKTCFSYEEFYPNHDYDIRDLAKHFFKYFLSETRDENAEFKLSDIILYEQKQYKINDFVKILNRFREEVLPAKLELMEFGRVEFDIEKKTGFADGYITFSVFADGHPTAHVSGFFNLNVLYNDFYWEICGMNFPRIE